MLLYVPQTKFYDIANELTQFAKESMTNIVYMLDPNADKLKKVQIMKEASQGNAMVILCDEELFQFAHSKKQLIINLEVPDKEEIYAKRIPDIRLLLNLAIVSAVFI